MSAPPAIRRRRARRDAATLAAVFIALLVAYAATLIAKGWFCWPFI